MNARVSLFKSVGTLLERLPARVDVALARTVAVTLGRRKGSARSNLCVNVAHALGGEGIDVAPALLDYVQALVAHTRHSPGLNAGLSPRAAIGLLRAARAFALITGRDAVIPEHVQAVFAAVVEHRLRQRDSGPTTVTRLLEAVPIP